MKQISIWLIFLLMAAQVSWAHNLDETTLHLKEKIQMYLDSTRVKPDWLSSRLQMFWQSHSKDVFVNGENFGYPGGERSIYPTVKLEGSRSHGTDYCCPSLKDVIPYYDDSLGSVAFINKQTQKMEKISPAKSGRLIGSLNRHILGIACDAAKVYEATKEECYAQMAFQVFDTYMKGIYGRNVPIDLKHSHIQNMVGLTSFEVIHEDIINECTAIYKVLRSYKPCLLNACIYDAAFKKWAENIIPSGVPHNNWDLIQATFLVRIALVLQSNQSYSDGKGKEYYLDYVVNRSSDRQWSVGRLAEIGFDGKTHIWFESPGYSINVVKDFVIFADMMDREAGIDLFKKIPLISQAVFASPQYLFPNRMVCGFGDTHPNYVNLTIPQLLENYALRHHNDTLALKASDLKKALSPNAPSSLIEQYVAPIFYSQNVSWLMQRSGMDKNHDLAISINGSMGNHQHANGINIELYGKGFVLAPDAGIGRVLYSGRDYHEYYSRFPAHNTVCVDGRSDYQVMSSEHPFKVEFLKNQRKHTVSQVSFIEPATKALQLRTNGIVKTEMGGYYIDIFRSKRQDGKDKFHDYFYHNIGQKMDLVASTGKPLELKTVDNGVFGANCIKAYSYIHDISSVSCKKDVKATFTTVCPDGKEIDMTMWMQGMPERKVFRALSPVNLEYERLADFMPYKVDQQPVLTYIARQYGDAWSHPFVAVYEPSDTNAPSEIERVDFFTPKGENAVGIKVVFKSGRIDYIFSAPKKTLMKYGKMQVYGNYIVISNGKVILEI